MTHLTQRDDAITLFTGVLRGRVGRRDLLLRAAALGLGVTALDTLLGAERSAAAAQDGTPAAMAASGSLTWGLEQDPGNLIPFGGVSSSNMRGKELMYDSLLEWDQELNIQPALAESYEASEDATSYTFKLREGVLFHNGKEMTAADVKYSFETALNPPAPGIEVAFLANIASVEAVDDCSTGCGSSAPLPRKAPQR